MFFDPEGAGTLVISSIREDVMIDDDYLEDMLDEHLDDDADLYDENCGDFSGVSCCYDDGDEYWCEWYLYFENVLVFVTYNCPLDAADDEEDVVDSMLDSLIHLEQQEPVIH